MSRENTMLRIMKFILNEAGADELSAIQEAVNRRTEDLQKNSLKLNISTIAKRVSENVNQQLSSFTNIHGMARNFIRELILKQNPDIPEEHLKALLEEWAPSPQKKGGANYLPAGILESMIIQFVDYSLGRMHPDTQRELSEGWQEKYWRHFPVNVQQSVSDFLKGEITENDFWDEIKEEIRKNSGEGT